VVGGWLGLELTACAYECIGFKPPFCIAALPQPILPPHHTTHSRLFGLPSKTLSSRAGALFTAIGLDDAGKQRRLVRSRPSLLSLPTPTVEQKIWGLAEAVQLLRGGSAPRAAATGGGGGGVSYSSDSRSAAEQPAAVDTSPITPLGADAAPKAAAAAAAGPDAALLEHACWLVTQVPTALGLHSEKLKRRARRLRRLADEFPPWAQQLAKGWGSARAGRALLMGARL